MVKLDKEYFDSEEPYKYLVDLQQKKPFNYKKEVEAFCFQAKEVGIMDFKGRLSAYKKQYKPNSQMQRSEGNFTEFSGQTVALNTKDWIATDNGIMKLQGERMCVACPHPIMPIGRLTNVEGGGKKLLLMFRRGNGNWREIVADSATVANARNIVKLHENDISVTSVNASSLVEYIADLEDANYDTLMHKESIGRLGWVEGKGFMPYTKNLVFDGNENMRSALGAVGQYGDFEKWLDAVREIRKTDSVARFALASAFCAPLMKFMNCLPFITHIYGTESGIGKTVALMLGASVWANPQKDGGYIRNFDGTAVGRENALHFFHDLPFIVDELQLARGDRKDFDQAIYQMAQGQGRERGAKTGGTQKLLTWNCNIISSGETPVTNINSASGAVARTVEIYANKPLVSDARRFLSIIFDNYGHAGKIFVEYLQKSEVKKKAREIFDQTSEKMIQHDIASKQITAGAMILTADYLATECIFKDKQNLKVSDILPFLSTNKDINIGERAYDYIIDYIGMNESKFLPDSGKSYETWGRFFEKDNLQYCDMIPEAFVKCVTEKGYEPSSLVKQLVQNGKIEKNGTRFQCTARIGTSVKRVYRIVMPTDILEEIEDENCPFP